MKLHYDSKMLQAFGNFERSDPHPSIDRNEEFENIL